MKPAFLQSTWATIFLTALTPIIWGSTYLVTTELLPADRPLMTAVIRTLPAGFILIIMTRRFRPGISWARLSLMSLLNIGAFQALLFVAAYRLPGGIAAIFGALQPIIMLGLTWSVDKRRPRIVTMAMALLGWAGMFLLIASPGSAWDVIGLVAALGGTVSMALGTFLSQRWRGSMPVLAFTGWQLSIGGLLLLPLALFLEPPLPKLGLAHGVGFAYLTLPGTLAAYVLWFKGISRLSPVAVSALGLLSPVTAIALGWIVLGESLGQRELVGISIILASVSALQFTKPRTRRPVPVRQSLASTTTVQVATTRL